MKVYYCNVENLPLNENLINILSQGRKQRLEKSSKKNALAGAELLLYYTLGERAEYTYLKNGKPVFTNLPLHFSLSHSGNYVACAVSSFLVGVDIQIKKEYNERVAKRVLNLREFNEVNHSKDKAKAFLELWVKKEASAKYSGKGLREILLKLSYKKASALVFENFAVACCPKGEFTEVSLDELLKFCERLK